MSEVDRVLIDASIAMVKALSKISDLEAELARLRAPVDPPERVSEQDAGGSIREGVVRGWIIGVGFDDETETHTEYEITDRKPCGDEASWLKVTLIAGEWVERVSEASALRDFAEGMAEGDCEYGDDCTVEAMWQRRHGMCDSCRARRALEDTKGEG